MYKIFKFLKDKEPIFPMKDERLKEIENKSISKEAVDFIEEEQIGYEDKRWI